jgi:hypothetical protein
MDTINDVLNKMALFFNSRNIPFVVGGGYAISLLCEKYSIQVPFDVNNLDIFYMANTSITPEMISSYRRKQSSPCTSLTYVAEDGFEINLTMIRSHYINIITVGYNNIKVMHPKQLISYYNDEYERSYIQDFKIFVLNTIMDSIKEEQIFCLNKNNQIIIQNTSGIKEYQGHSRNSRISLDFNKLLHTVTE